jgi:uncharacterized protein
MTSWSGSCSSLGQAAERHGIVGDGERGMVKRPFDIDARLAALVGGELEAQFEMAIDADGTWLYQGSKIQRPALVELFATALQRAADGSYWLVTPVEAGRLRVADVPFTIVELAAVGEGAARTLRLRTNLDGWVELDAEHPLVMRAPPEGGTPVPYATVRPACGSRLAIEARLLRPVFYHLVELAEPLDDSLVVRSAGATFRLGRGAAP